MTGVPRRTLEELEFIYRRDPDRRDIYVEGQFDLAVVRWFGYTNDLQDLAVYPIESIDLPERKIIEARGKTGNRDRVVFLANFLRDVGVQKATCIVDADFGHIRGEESGGPPLFQTDYSCMEMYFFAEANIAKFLVLGCRRQDWPARRIIGALSAPLQELFLFRCANDDLGWNLDWLDKVSCLEVDNWEIRLDAEAFIERLLNKNGRAGEKSIFVSQVALRRSALKPDPRFQMHGHDLVAVLSWYLRKKGVSGQRSRAENIASYLVMSLDHRVLGRESMFRAILDRVS